MKFTRKSEIAAIVLFEEALALTHAEHGQPRIGVAATVVGSLENPVHHDAFVLGEVPLFDNGLPGPRAIRGIEGCLGERSGGRMLPAVAASSVYRAASAAAPMGVLHAVAH